jgi:anthranilate phosphoribosyltransferase
VDSIDQAADALMNVIKGHASPMRDIAVLNAAAALVIAQSCPDLATALSLAQDAIDNGKAAAALKLLIQSSREG